MRKLYLYHKFFYYEVANWDSVRYRRFLKMSKALGYAKKQKCKFYIRLKNTTVYFRYHNHMQGFRGTSYVTINSWVVNDPRDLKLYTMFGMYFPSIPYPKKEHKIILRDKTRKLFI